MKDEVQRLRQRLRDEACELCEICGEVAVVKSDTACVCLSCGAVWRRTSLRSPWSLVAGSRDALVCLECERVADVEAHGWLAFSVKDPDVPEAPSMMVVYCPECAEREFGLPRRR